MRFCSWKNARSSLAFSVCVQRLHGAIGAVRFSWCGFGLKLRIIGEKERATMRCQNCGKEVGEARFCPNCGSAIDKGQSVKKNVGTGIPVSPVASSKKKPIYKRVWFWAAIVILAFVFYLNSENDTSKTNERSTKPVSPITASTTDDSKGNRSNSQSQPDSKNEDQVLPKETKEDFVASCEEIPYAINQIEY